MRHKIIIIQCVLRNDTSYKKKNQNYFTLSGPPIISRFTQKLYEYHAVWVCIIHQYELCVIVIRSSLFIMSTMPFDLAVNVEMIEVW